jgi:aminopeptidase-like protein
LREVISDTPVFDWTVPDEWNIRDAYIMNEAGDRVVDFRKSNLHVLNYSLPVTARCRWRNFDRIFSPFPKLRTGSPMVLLTIRKVNLNPKCEPQLGRRGLYGQLGGMKDAAVLERAMLWVLNFSDGRNDLLDIAIRSGIALEQISKATEALRGAGLLGR